MKIQISVSAKQVGVLYHMTTKKAVLSILRTGKMQLSMGRGFESEKTHVRDKVFFASLTRSRLGGYHMKEELSTMDDTHVMVTLDGNRLSDRYRIVSVDYYGHRGKTDAVFQRNKEMEERLVSDKDEIPILKYIKRIDFVQLGVMGRKETYGPDAGKFQTKTNKKLQQALGSIVLQLKKRKIPYAFYDSMKDWAFKRNEYAYTGPKDVDVSVPQSRHMFDSERKDLEDVLLSLAERPYEKLSKEAQNVAYKYAKYPSDYTHLKNLMENHRKPEANPYLRKLVVKITRQMTRLGLTTYKQLAEHLAEKYNAHSRERERIHRIKVDTKFAAALVATLAEPEGQWPDTGLYYDPKKVFSGEDDPMGMDGRNLSEQVDQLLERDLVPETKQFRDLLSERGLEGGVDYVFYVFRVKRERAEQQQEDNLLAQFLIDTLSKPSEDWSTDGRVRRYANAIHHLWDEAYDLDSTPVRRLVRAVDDLLRRSAPLIDKFRALLVQRVGSFQGRNYAEYLLSHPEQQD